METELAPIALFVYNRLWHTQKTIESLIKNSKAKDSVLYIFSDAPKSDIDRKSVKDVRDYIWSINGFKDIQIQEREQNLGLATSIISGVSAVIKKNGKIIVVEDDLIASRNFVQFMNDCLDFYQGNDKIFSVSGYSYPIEIPKSYKNDLYLLPRSSSWGWGTWLDKWSKADWEIKDYSDFIRSKNKRISFNIGGDDLTDMLISQKRGKIDSWAIRWCYAHYKNSAFCLYPRVSKIQNIGNDNSGTHSKKTKKYLINIDDGESSTIFKPDIVVSNEIVENLTKFYRRKFHKRIIRIIRKKLNI
ncbi:MAG: sugar transferase [Ignavibacteriaceae bacterium]